jgi:hypothetical protein
LLACAGAAGAAAKTPAKPPTKPPVKQAAPPVAAAPAPAAASAPVISEAAAAEINHAFKTYVVPRFAVLPDSELEPEVRTAALAMQAEHLPRARALMERWLLEELQQPNPQRAFPRMLARLANEFALWGRDSTGADQDAALAQALQIPGMCRPAGAKSSELVMRLSRLRGLPAEMRQAAVKAEAELLGRWGSKRSVSEAEPLAAEEALLRLRATGQASKTPLPPVLAFYYLGEQDDTRRDPELAEPAVRCAIHQWAGAEPAQFRAAMAMQAADLFWADRRKAAAAGSDDDPYPKLPSYFGIRGVVTVAADVNSEGRVVRAKVVKREVEVPGIRDARPYAHEGVLELASLAKARELDWSAAAPKQGLKTVEREIAWSLAWR